MITLLPKNLDLRERKSTPGERVWLDLCPWRLFRVGGGDHLGSPVRGGKSDLRFQIPAFAGTSFILRGGKGP